MQKHVIYSRRFSAAHGWRFIKERECSFDELAEWMKIFHDDEPGIDFVNAPVGHKPKLSK